MIRICLLSNFPRRVTDTCMIVQSWESVFDWLVDDVRKVKIPLYWLRYDKSIRLCVAQICFGDKNKLLLYRLAICFVATRFCSKPRWYSSSRGIDIEIYFVYACVYIYICVCLVLIILQIKYSQYSQNMLYTLNLCKLKNANTHFILILIFSNL